MLHADQQHLLRWLLRYYQLNSTGLATLLHVGTHGSATWVTVARRGRMAVASNQDFPSTDGPGQWTFCRMGHRGSLSGTQAVSSNCTFSTGRLSWPLGRDAPLGQRVDDRVWFQWLVRRLDRMNNPTEDQRKEDYSQSSAMCLECLNRAEPGASF